MAAGFRARAAVDERRLFSDTWLQAAPERRKHLLALTITRELRALQRPDCLGDLDYTHPFADRPLLEFLLRVPAHVLCTPHQPRRLMRRALADLWPQRLRSRRSKGLFDACWADALRPFVTGAGDPARWEVVERGWVDRASLASRLTRLAHGAECNAAQLRQIVLLECWLRARAARPMDGDARMAS